MHLQNKICKKEIFDILDCVGNRCPNGHVEVSVWLMGPSFLGMYITPSS